MTVVQGSGLDASVEAAQRTVVVRGVFAGHGLLPKVQIA